MTEPSADGARAHETGVKDASWSQTYSYLPASWAGDTHEETDFLPIGDREEKERCLDRRTDSLEATPVLMAKYRADGSQGFEAKRLDC